MTEQTTSLTAAEIDALNARFAGPDPKDILAWALDRFHPRIALASSFGAEDVALIDMLDHIQPGARVVTLDTLRLHTETYDVIDRVRARYSADVQAFFPDLAAVDRLVRERGYNCFYASVDN